MLVSWALLVGCEKGKDGRHVRAGACGELVDGAHDTLVDLGATFAIWVRVFGDWNGVDGKARAPWGHVGDLVHDVDAKMVGGLLCKSGLGKVHGHVAVLFGKPCERCAMEKLTSPMKSTLISFSNSCLNNFSCSGLVE